MVKSNRSMGVAEIKARLSEVLRAVEQHGAPVVIHRRGRPVAMIVGYDPALSEDQTTWIDELRGAAENIDDFESVMRQVMASRQEYPPRETELFDAKNDS